MQLWKKTALSLYYQATLPARRRAAVVRAVEGIEPIQIVFYHRVADDHPNGWTIDCETFVQQINWMRERFDLVDMAEAQQRIAAEKNSKPTVCLTFDDGYADNCHTAIPFLLKNGIPFTYFVSTDHVLGGQSFAHDEKAGVPLQPNSLEQLRELAQAGVEIGSHTCSHADLGQSLSTEQLEHEIIGSKALLEDALDVPIRYFAFPFGMPENMSHRTFQMAHAEGYQGVCSAYGAYNFPGDDPFHLRRYHGDPDTIALKNWLTIDPRKLKSGVLFDPGRYKPLMNANRR